MRQVHLGQWLVLAVVSFGLAACSVGEVEISPSERPTMTAVPPTQTFPHPTATPLAYPSSEQSVLPTSYSGPLPDGAVSRLGIGRINAVDLSPDGEHFAVGTSIGLFLYRLDTLQRVWYSPTNCWVYDVEFSPDGTLVLSWQLDRGDVILWNVDTGTQLDRIESATPSASIRTSGSEKSAFAPDSTMLALLNADGDITVWDLKKQEQVAVLEIVPAIAKTIRWSPDGNIIAVLQGDKVALWDVTTRSWLDSLNVEDAGEAPGDIVWSPDGKLLAFTGSGKMVTIWDVSTNEKLRVFDIPEYAFAPTLAWLPNGSMLAVTGISHDKVLVWNVDTGRQTLALEGGNDHVAWSPDGKRIASGDRESNVVICWF